MLQQLGTLETVRACLESAAEHAAGALRRAGLAELLEVDKDVRKLLAKVAVEPVRVNPDTFLDVATSTEAARAISRAGRVRRRQDEPAPFVITKEAVADLVARSIKLACSLAKEDAKNCAHVKEGGKKGVFELDRDYGASGRRPASALVLLSDQREGRKWSCCGAKEEDARGCLYTAPPSLDQYVEAAFVRLSAESNVIKNL